MKNIIDLAVEYLFQDLCTPSPNSVLLYGDSACTLSTLKSVYDAARVRDEFLCSWHDASTITQPMDFFEPILRLKYGDKFSKLQQDADFRKLSSKNEKGGVFQLAELCRKEEESKILNFRKMPIIFIDGIEQLFFKLDYGHLDREQIEKVLYGGFMDQPLPKGFGDCLRGYLHQLGNGVFYGTIKDIEGIEFRCTLGNYHYQFYEDNFMRLPLD